MNSGTCIERRVIDKRNTNHHQQSSPSSSTSSSPSPIITQQAPAFMVNNNNDNNNNNNETYDGFSIENFYKLMKYERLRLITYILYDHQWTKFDIISPISLAKAGFFYYKDDIVCCAFCRGKIRNWEMGDVAMEEHVRHFPNCPFVQDKPVGNVPIETDPDVNCNNHSKRSNYYIDNDPGQEPITLKYNKTMQPKYPQFIEKQKRELTFSHANWSTSNKPDKRLFVDAGFFYIGKEDHTRCYHCGGNLKNWNENEIPMEEHALFFPECPYIISVKGANYLEFVKFKNQIIKMRSKMNTSHETKSYDINCMRKITFENFQSMKQAAKRIINRLSDTEDIQKTYEEYLDKFFFFLDCNRLFYHLSIMNVIRGSKMNYKSNNFHQNSDDSENSDHNNNSNNNDNQDVMNSISSMIFRLPESSDSDYSSSNSDCEDNCSFSTSNNSDSTLSFAIDDNDKSKLNDTISSLKCMLCCDKMIQVVFIPCGHQMACMKCSTNLNKCPICRKVITNKIRTYFATYE